MLQVIITLLGKIIILAFLLVWFNAQNIVAVIAIFLIDDQRVYAYVRFETGDEMSRRAKFAFITWIGPGVSPLKKAKVSTDKAFVKNAWPVNSFFVCVKNLL